MAAPETVVFLATEQGIFTPINRKRLVVRAALTVILVVAAVIYGVALGRQVSIAQQNPVTSTLLQNFPACANGQEGSNVQLPGLMLYIPNRDVSKFDAGLRQARIFPDSIRGSNVRSVALDAPKVNDFGTVALWTPQDGPQCVKTAEAMLLLRLRVAPRNPDVPPNDDVPNPVALITFPPGTLDGLEERYLSPSLDPSINLEGRNVTFMQTTGAVLVRVKAVTLKNKLDSIGLGLHEETEESVYEIRSVTTISSTSDSDQLVVYVQFENLQVEVRETYFSSTWLDALGSISGVFSLGLALVAIVVAVTPQKPITPNLAAQMAPHVQKQIGPGAKDHLSHEMRRRPRPASDTSSGTSTSASSSLI